MHQAYSGIPCLSLTALSGQGRWKNAILIFLTSHKPSFHSSSNAQLLKVCIHKNALSEGKQFYSQISERGHPVAKNTFLQNTLINMYDKCGRLVDARQTFDNMTEPNMFSWNAIIGAYTRHGPPQQALTLFHEMQATGAQPDEFTFAIILHLCANAASLKHGLQIHGTIIRRGFQSPLIVMNTLIHMYIKYGCIHQASELFDKMPERDVVSWTSVVAGYTRIGFVEKALEIFRQMLSVGVKPSLGSFSSVLPAVAKVGALKQGMEIHGKIIESLFLSDDVVVTALIDMYAKCGSIQKANKLFDTIGQPNVVSWTAIMAGCSQSGFVDRALDIFKKMQLAGVKPNFATFASILPACARKGDLEQGMKIHQNVIKNGFLSNMVINALIDMYGKCGSIQQAQVVFDTTRQRNVISWNAMIVGYVQNGMLDKALGLFKQVEITGVKPDCSTFSSILPACAKLEALEQGMETHQKVIKRGFLSDVVLLTALIDMYAKCGSVQKSHILFNKMPQRNVVSWTAIIAGYAQNGLVEKALEIFKQMLFVGVKPNFPTFVSILPACAKMGALEHGMEIHQKIVEGGLLSYGVVATALIDMYAKCGSIHKARGLFDKMDYPDVATWNALIAGYAMHGYSRDALKLFELMEHFGTNPDIVSFICVLYACSHAGAVDNGCQYFHNMRNFYGIEPTVDHYVCMVDLLARAGYLEKTLNFITKMPITPDAAIWICLLGACRSYNNIALGEFVARLLFDLDPKNTAPYVLLSNIYAEVGRQGDAQKVRKLMRDRGISKVPGCSWIEVHKMMHAFCVGDRSHPQTEEIYAELEKLSWEMKAEGYNPDTAPVVNDVEEEEKKLLVCHHSEKLAIAFGLLNTSPGTTIRVAKNLRVCRDCHTATKLISKIVAREIVVRDANRFHHFKHGQCSCGDYW
ncbi:pentatricopeptide repeat-containing protein At4g21065-like [Cryptomeria japonica]|uniref:pentatricopeptide repeat-containing protein At4g21065-like n=1 Tax=Cryptomeria japonica TaxID=3369 RepID=UPI0027DA9015|nr:pentatricopeptide repeat-containing protein At4g21065-like [Cryptomeria japonica]